MMEFRDINGDTSFDKQTIARTCNKTSYQWQRRLVLSHIRGFTGLDREQQHELYYKLKEHTLSEDYVYTHKWEPMM